MNLGSSGVVPVAVLSTEMFSAATVDPSSVILAGSGMAVCSKGKTLAHIQDVNGDALCTYSSKWKWKILIQDSFKMVWLP